MFLLFCQYIQINLSNITHNIPAVYEVGGSIKGLCEAKTAAANLPK